MVVEPELALGRLGVAQPGIKVRGREDPRLVHGCDFTEPQHLERLAHGEPLWRVHECVFAVLALESEPVDSRL